MKMVTVDKCCCCYQLTTGGLIMGWLGVFSSLFAIMLCSFILYVGYEDFVNALVPDDPEMRDELRNFKWRKNQKLFEIQFSQQFSPTVFLLIIILYIITCLLSLVCAMLLIRGTMKVINCMHSQLLVVLTRLLYFQRNSKLILPWLIVEMICIAFGILSTLSQYSSVPRILSGMIGIGVHIYLWVCIYSLYKVVEDEIQEKAPTSVTVPTSDELPPPAPIEDPVV